MKHEFLPVTGLAKRSGFSRTENTVRGSAGEFDLTIEQALREINSSVSGTDPSGGTSVEKLTRVIRLLEMQMRFNESLLQIIREMDGRGDIAGQSTGSVNSASLNSLATALTDAKTKKGAGVLEKYSRAYSTSARETSLESRLVSLERRIEAQRREASTGNPSTRPVDEASITREPAVEKSASVRKGAGEGRKVNNGTTPAMIGKETSNYDEIIDYASRTYGVDPDLIRAVIRAESSFNPESTSTKGAMGLMQLMPATAKDLGVNDPYDPVENIMGGTRYLRGLLDRFGNNRNLALAAYNWGMGNVERKPGRMPQETRIYVARVNQYYRENKA